MATENKKRKYAKASSTSRGRMKKKTRTSASQISLLPEDIIFDILKRLPAKSLMRFKCVSKAWLSLISDRRFARSHRIHAEIRPEASHLLFDVCFYNTDLGRDCRAIFPANLEGKFSTQIPVSLLKDSCCRLSNAANGLVCLSVPKTRKLYVINLTTSETKALPAIKGLFSQVSRLYLGFDPRTEEYKLLHFGSRQHGILTLGSNSWRRMDSRKFYIMGHPTCIDGVLYWPDHIILREGRCIESFDLREEKFHQLFLPKNKERMTQQQEVRVPRKFAFTHTHIHNLGKEFSVLRMWILNTTDQTWSEHEIRLPTAAPMVVGRTETGEVLLKRGFCGSISELFFLDLTKGTCRIADFPWPQLMVTHAISNHVENILPLRFLSSKN